MKSHNDTTEYASNSAVRFCSFQYRSANSATNRKQGAITCPTIDEGTEAPGAGRPCWWSVLAPRHPTAGFLPQEEVGGGQGTPRACRAGPGRARVCCFFRGGSLCPCGLSPSPSTHTLPVGGRVPPGIGALQWSPQSPPPCCSAPALSTAPGRAPWHRRGDFLTLAVGFSALSL